MKPLDIIRRLWRWAVGTLRKQNYAPTIEKRWSHTERGTLLRLRRNTPGALSSYRFNMLGCDRELLLLCDNLRVIRRWLKNSHSDRFVRQLLVPFEVESGVAAAINRAEASHLIILAWGSKITRKDGRINIFPLGIYSANLDSLQGDRITEAIFDRFALYLWRLKVEGFGWDEALERSRIDFLLDTYARSFLGKHHEAMVERH